MTRLTLEWMVTWKRMMKKMVWKLMAGVTRYMENRQLPKGSFKEEGHEAELFFLRDGKGQVAELMEINKRNRQVA